MIAKRFIVCVLLISCLYSCKQNTNDNYRLLEFVLNDSNYTINDSLIFKEKVTSKSINNFFKRRNRENMVLIAKDFKKGKSATKTDSATIPKRNIISVKEPITRNEYLLNGKGIDKKAEAFLKDSFNYKSIDTIKWSLDKKLKTIFLSDIKLKKTLTISKPVYNVGKNKAIIHKKITKGNWISKTIYFLSKENGKWILVFKESDTHYYFK